MAIAPSAISITDCQRIGGRCATEGLLMEGHHSGRGRVPCVMRSDDAGDIDRRWRRAVRCRARSRAAPSGLGMGTAAARPAGIADMPGAGGRDLEPVPERAVAGAASVLAPARAALRHAWSVLIATARGCRDVGSGASCDRGMNYEMLAG